MSKNIAVILAGGSGSRFGRENTPKQFLKVAGKKVIEKERKLKIERNPQ